MGSVKPLYAALKPAGTKKTKKTKIKRRQRKGSGWENVRSKVALPEPCNAALYRLAGDEAHHKTEAFCNAMRLVLLLCGLLLR